MPFPNPANYYLPTPEALESEVESLDVSELAQTLREVSELLDKTLDGEEIEFETLYRSNRFDAWVNNLQVDALINLIRWLAERMASLYTKESRNA